MKKIRIVILSVLLGLMLCACGEEQQDSQIQQMRTDLVCKIAGNYAIDTISEMAQNPAYFVADYTELTYDELAQAVLDYPGIRTDGYVLSNAISSFQKGFEEAGAIVSWGEPVATVDGNEIIVDFECVCERRYADIEFIFKNDLSDPQMLSATFNARYTMAEKMSKAGLNTLIGMGTVFVMLIVISFIISLFGLFSGHGKKPDKTEEGINKAVEQIEKNENAELASNAELVAVIAAAIAAYEGAENTSGFVVRSVKKIKRQ